MLDEYWFYYLLQSQVLSTLLVKPLTKAPLPDGFGALPQTSPIIESYLSPTPSPGNRTFCKHSKSQPVILLKTERKYFSICTLPHWFTCLPQENIPCKGHWVPDQKYRRIPLLKNKKQCSFPKDLPLWHWEVSPVKWLPLSDAPMWSQQAKELPHEPWAPQANLSTSPPKCEQMAKDSDMFGKVFPRSISKINNMDRGGGYGKCKGLLRWCVVLRHPGAREPGLKFHSATQGCVA